MAANKMSKKELDIIRHKSTYFLWVLYLSLLICDNNEVLASFLSKMFNHQIVGTDTNEYRLLILPYGRFTIAE